jgi:ABC-type Fe3+/spermidine/putrescine transport system ATPase subunit
VATLEVRSLSRSYPDEVVALRDASFTVEDGRIAAILGPSGCGKTTLLRLIAGLDRPDTGDVLLDGVSILRRPVHRRGVGMMFQDLALFPHMSVRDNIMFGLRMQHWPKADRLRRAADLIDAVGLAGKEERRVHELSGGEQQRVALARTLAPNPGVLLLDEPLGSLDEVLKSQLRGELREVLKALETTALIVSHDLRDAVTMADDLIVMDRGDVLQAGMLSQVLAGPASALVASMTGYVELARGSVDDGRITEHGGGSVAAPHGFAPRTSGVAMAHPTALLGVPPESGLGCGVQGTVIRARALGPMFLLDLAVADRTIEVRWEWDLVPPPTGAEIAIAVRPGTLRFFDLSPETEHTPLPYATDDDLPNYLEQVAEQDVEPAPSNEYRGTPSQPEMVEQVHSRLSRISSAPRHPGATPAETRDDPDDDLPPGARPTLRQP